MSERNFEVLGDVVSAEGMPLTTQTEDKENSNKKEENNLIEDPTVFDSDIKDNGNGVTPCIVPDNSNLD